MTGATTDPRAAIRRKLLRAVWLTVAWISIVFCLAQAVTLYALDQSWLHEFTVTVRWTKQGSGAPPAVDHPVHQWPRRVGNQD